MQSQSKKSNSHVYDYVIVGAGLSGLTVATALSHISDNVLLLDGSDTFGGASHSVPVASGAATDGSTNVKANNGLRFLPDTELSRKALHFLEQLLGESLNITSEESTPQTFEAGGLRPFVGFGENPPAFYDELAYFLSPARLHTDTQPYEWVQKLANLYKGEFAAKSYVTKFLAADPATPDKVTGVMINGQKTINGHNFIFCGSVKDLQMLLPENGISARAKQKLSKGPYWTAVGLDILHACPENKPVSEVFTTHLLNGTTDDEVGPCVGRFYPAIENSTASGTVMQQYSQWVSFVDNEDAEDSENIGITLKKMKRQIKRAYPTALDAIAFERIVIAALMGGNGELKLNANQALPSLPNLWIASGTVHPQRNLVGTLLQAELVCSALACHPAGVQVAAANDQAAADWNDHNEEPVQAEL